MRYYGGECMIAGNIVNIVDPRRRQAALRGDRRGQTSAVQCSLYNPTIAPAKAPWLSGKPLIDWACPRDSVTLGAIVGRAG